MRRTWVRVYEVEVEVRVYGRTNCSYIRLFSYLLVVVTTERIMCWLAAYPELDVIEVEAALEWSGRQMTDVPKVEPAEVQPLQALHH